MSKKPLLIFDHDGTLHASMYIFGPAMKKGVEMIEEKGYGRIPDLTDEKISSLLGLTSYDIWKKLKSDLSDEAIEKVSYYVNTEMRKLLDVGKARWYDGAKEALDKLKADGYHMVILSNCDIRLAEFYWDYFKMENWFDKFYDSESYGYKPKTEVIKYIIEERGSEAIMIGDRDKDLECAKAVAIPFIGCSYGFAEEGELNDADEIADSPYDIARLAEKISKERYGA